MPLSIPPELKKINPYIRRAEELDRDKSSAESRLVAYYCRQYAVHTGIPLTGSSAAAKTCLGQLLATLESEKPAMDNFTRDEAVFLCRKFAYTVFDKADGEDRMGMATKGTAKTFYAAATFLEILKQFSEEGDVSAEAVEDRKKTVYAKWKSTEILKAIKEGRTPTPGGYGEDDMGLGDDDDKDEENESDEKKVEPPAVETVPDDEMEVTKKNQSAMNDHNNPAPAPMEPPTFPTFPRTPHDEEQERAREEEDESNNEEGLEIELGPPPAYPPDDDDTPKLTFDLPPPMQPPKAVPKAATSPKKSTSMFGFGKKKSSGGKASKAMLADAMELTKFALAALEDKDGDLAAERLQKALVALGR